MNHQGLLWNVHCIVTVVLRKQFNFKSAVIRSERSSCFETIKTILKNKLKVVFMKPIINLF